MVAPIVILSLFVLAMSFGTSAVARDRYLYDSARFTATYNGADVTLFIGINDEVQMAPIDHLEISRRPHGSCQVLVRINDTPIHFEPGTLNLINYVDTGIEAGRTYEYHLAACDAAGEPVDIQWGWGWPFRAWTSVGSSPITHGELGPSPYGGLMVAACPEGCYGSPWFVEVSDELLPYVNTGTRLLLYGHFTRFLPQFGWVFTLTSGQPQDCTIAIAPISWSGAKSIYRQ